MGKIEMDLFIPFISNRGANLGNSTDKSSLVTPLTQGGQNQAQKPIWNMLDGHSRGAG